MWPRNTIPGARHARRRRAGAAARAAISVACLLTFALDARARESGVAAPSHALREKDVRRAEKVLARLRLLDEAARGGACALRERASKLYPGLFITVAEMHPSDLKTDLDTAVYLYEEAARTWLTTADPAADCARERRDTYLPLCLELGRATRGQLLVSKARLHARWAEAVVKDFRGEAEAETLGLVSAMRQARAHDLVIAARVLETLKTLEPLVNNVGPYAERRGRDAATAVRFERLDGEFGDAVRRAGSLIASLPRGPAFYDLSNAWRGYKEGLFWYRKVHQTKKLVVSANGFAGDPLKDLRLDAEQVSGTAFANWEAALKSMRSAERYLSTAAR